MLDGIEQPDQKQEDFKKRTTKSGKWSLNYEHLKITKITPFERKYIEHVTKRVKIKNKKMAAITGYQKCKDNDMTH